MNRYDKVHKGLVSLGLAPGETDEKKESFPPQKGDVLVLRVSLMQIII